ncbi:ABC transporter ATP-binding protein/permease [Acetobacteraceae bacterium H6797]|nr:ABC transporter ATP-binding protein/permease [Acetobacteraceae bacterium H6797]
MRRLGPFLHDAWALTRPYWNSEERWRARLLLGVVVALNLLLVFMNVVLTYWQNAFYNTLQEKDWSAFINLLLLGGRGADGGFMPGFSVVAAAYIVVAVYALYLQQALQIRWRRWLTERYLGAWLGNRAYYRLSLADGATDNPDQRIAEDTRLFVDDTLTLGLGLIKSVVTFFSFIFVLWGLSGPLDVLGVNIPGYLVWVAIIYSLLGTWLAHLIGRRLIGLNFIKQRVEADFRFALVRLRENVEGVALHGGEPDEHRGLTGRFKTLMENWWAIMVTTKHLTFFTAGFSQVASIFPIIVAAPAYFAGKMQLGGLIQTSTAFGQVQGSLSWVVDHYQDLSEWRASVERLTGFERAIATAVASGDSGPRVYRHDGALTVQNLDLSLPGGRALLGNASASILPGESVLLTGASGSGKSTLFRALAGLWPFGSGTIHMPPEEQILFLPQRAYMPLGSLRRAVSYPRDASDFSDAEIVAALKAAGLERLVSRLDDEAAWERQLSGGEQQRLAIARALLLRPLWLFLDEATASLDPAAEEELYAKLKEALPGSSIISIAHRPAVAQFHDRHLLMKDGGLQEAPAA